MEKLTMNFKKPITTSLLENTEWFIMDRLTIENQQKFWKWNYQFEDCAGKYLQKNLEDSLRVAMDENLKNDLNEEKLFEKTVTIFKKRFEQFLVLNKINPVTEYQKLKRQKKGIYS